MTGASRRIVLTGASRGIGATVAQFLACNGRTLALTARSLEALEETASRCREAGAQVHCYAVDLASAREVTRFAHTVLQDLGEVDLLVNNAGVVGPEGLPWEVDSDQWWETQLVNLRAPFLLQRALVPQMLARGGGRIVDLSSGAAVWDDDLCSSYFVSKTALLRLAGCLDLAGRDAGLRVFPVAPGVVQTNMTRGMKMHVGREVWNAPEEVATLIAAIADGELDELAGAQIRAGQDTVESLRQEIARGVGAESRRLRLSPWEYTAQETDTLGSIELSDAELAAGEEGSEA